MEKGRNDNSQKPSGALFEQALAQVRPGSVPEGGAGLLAESRRMRAAADSRELWLYMPFSMLCETLYGKKEGYSDIIRQFEEIKARDYGRMVRGACAGDRRESRELGLFLAACVDTLEFTSMEIYEHYRYLADLARATVRVLAKQCRPSGGRGGMEPETAGAIGGSVLKACRMGVLLQEKYEDYGLELLAHSRKGFPEREAVK